jgi:hypothetical protein
LRCKHPSPFFWSNAWQNVSTFLLPVHNATAHLQSADLFTLFSWLAVSCFESPMVAHIRNAWRITIIRPDYRFLSASL